jgi:hypothetical protein
MIVEFGDLAGVEAFADAASSHRKRASRPSGDAARVGGHLLIRVKEMQNFRA